MTKEDLIAENQELREALENIQDEISEILGPDEDESSGSEED